MDDLYDPGDVVAFRHPACQMPREPNYFFGVVLEVRNGDRLGIAYLNRTGERSFAWVPEAMVRPAFPDGAFIEEVT